MSTQLILKDLGEIHSRLFDHRPVLHGEIGYHLSEFETKRGGREEHRLQKSLEYARESSENLVQSSINQVENYLPKLSANVSTAVEMCNMILEREGKPEKADWLKEQHETRLREWSNFMDEMCTKSSAVDDKFKEEVANVDKYYKDLEDKLLQSGKHS